jgi:hypothetical protein
MSSVQRFAFAGIDANITGAIGGVFPDRAGQADPLALFDRAGVDARTGPEADSLSASWRDGPVLPDETVHTSEFRNIRSDQYRTGTERLGCDQQIVGSDRRASQFQRRA